MCALNTQANNLPNVAVQRVATLKLQTLALKYFLLLSISATNGSNFMVANRNLSSFQYNNSKVHLG